MAKKKRINPKHKAVALGYMQGKSKAQAVKDAGYDCSSLSSASHVADEILQKPSTIAYIEEINEKTESPMIASIEESMMFLTAVARDPIAKMKDRLKATDMKLKAQGAYIERIEHKHEIGGVTRLLSNYSKEELLNLSKMKFAIAGGVEIETKNGNPDGY